MKNQTITSKDEAKRELEKLKECAFLTPKVHQALDIAIESLQEDIQQKGIELMAKTIERKHYYPMPTLFKNDNINKYTATEVNTLIDSIADDIKKMLVEPYERKESKCQEEFDEELEILNGIYVED